MASMHHRLPRPGYRAALAKIRGVNVDEVELRGAEATNNLQIAGLNPRGEREGELKDWMTSALCRTDYVKYSTAK